MPLMKAELIENPPASGKDRFTVVIALKSERPNFSGSIWSRAELQFDSSIEKRVEAAGGALAEKQNVEHKDRHDPSECAQTAREVFRRLMVDSHQKGLI